MKKLISLMLCILLLTGCAATYDGPTVEKPVLTEYTVTHYSFNEVHYTNRTIYAYDIYGNRARAMEYRAGELQQISNMKYDDRGNLTSRTSWDYSGWFPKLSHREKRSYDDRNRILSSVYYDFWGRQTGGSWYTYDDTAQTRTYRDESGEILQIAWFDENGLDIRETAGEYETLYEYDDNGNLTGWISYENGTPIETYRARYDEQSRLIWSARYDASGALKSESEYVYDEGSGTMTYTKPDGSRHVEYYHPDGRLHMVEDYNEEGHLSLLQQYYYRDIQIPAEGGITP